MKSKKKRMGKKERWYDANQTLSESLEKLKGLDQKARDPIVKQLTDFVKTCDSDALHRFELQNIVPWGRRWYDKDAFEWLLLNGLQKADAKLLKKVSAKLSSCLP